MCYPSSTLQLSIYNLPTGQRKIRSGKNSEYPGRCSCCTFNRHGNNIECCSFYGKFVQVGNIFQGELVGSANSAVNRKILRLAVIDARRIEGDTFNAPFFHKKFRCCLRKSRKTQFGKRLQSFFICSCISGMAISPDFTHVSKVSIGCGVTE